MQPVQGNLPVVGMARRVATRPVLIKDIDDPRGWPVLQASLEALARGDIFGHNNLVNLVLQTLARDHLYAEELSRSI